MYMYYAEKVAHGLDLISPYFNFVECKPQMKKYLTCLSIGKI